MKDDRSVLFDAEQRSCGNKAHHQRGQLRAHGKKGAATADRAR
jgi:hypothetical protein